MISPLAECVVGVSFQANADVQSMGRKQPESKWVLIRNQLIGFSSSSLSAGYQFFDAESNVEHVTNKRATRLTHTALNDPLKLIGSDCRWLCYLFFFPPVKKSSNAPPRYLPAPRLSARVTSAGVLVVRLKKKRERVHKESCLMSPSLPPRESGRGQYSSARTNNSCQLSAEFTVEFENKFPSCKLGGSLGIWGAVPGSKTKSGFISWVLSAVLCCLLSVFIRGLRWYSYIVTFFTGCLTEHNIYIVHWPFLLLIKTWVTDASALVAYSRSMVFPQCDRCIGRLANLLLIFIPCSWLGF